MQRGLGSARGSDRFLGRRGASRSGKVSTGVLLTAACAGLGLWAPVVHAATYTWSNSSGGNWNLNTNWTPSTGVPGAADSATFNSGAGTPITVNINAGDIAASMIFDTANAAAYTFAGSALTLSDTTRTITINSTVTRDQLFNAPVLLGSTTANNTFTSTNNGSGLLTYAGGFSAAQTGTKTINLAGLGNTAVSGVIANGAGTVALTKGYTAGSTSVVTLTGANTYTGGTIVEVGKLRLDFANSALTSNIINNTSLSSALTLGRSYQNVATGATLDVVGGNVNGQTYSQRFNGTTFVVLQNNIRVTETAGTTVNLQLGALTRSNLSFVDFTLPTSGTITTTTTTNSNGVLTAGNGAYATVDGTDWVTNTSGTLGRLSSYTTAASATATSNVSVESDEALTSATINTLRFNSTSNRTLDLTGTHTISSGGILVTAASTNGATIGTSVDDGTLKPGSVNALNFNNRSAGTLTINSVLANGTGATDAIFLGNTLVTGTNTYTGTSRIYPGKTTIVNASNLGSGGTVVVYSGGTLELDGSAGGIALSAKSFTINGTGASGAGGAIRSVGNNSIGSIGIGNAAGTTVVHSASGMLAVGAINANNAQITLDGPGDFRLDGNVSLSTSSGAQFIKSGTGTLYANNSTNTYNTLNVNGGVYDSTLALLPSNGTGNSTIVLRSGTYQIKDGGTFSRTLASFGGTNTVRLEGTSGFAARGSDAAINFGGASAGVTWGSTGFLGGGGDELVLNSAIADRMIDVQNPINLASNIRTVRVLDNPSATTDFAKLSGALTSTVAANGGLIKAGAGTLLLTGTSTYQGATSVNAGTLLVGDGVSGSLGNTAVSVQSSVAGLTTVLGGSGSIGGSVTVNDGGRLAPGNGGVGTLTITNQLALNAGSNSDFDLASATSFDKVIGLTGGNFGGTLNVSGTVEAKEAVYQLFALSSGSATGNFGFVNLPAAPQSYQWRDFDAGAGTSYFDPSTGSIELIAIPEPAMLAVAGLSVPLLALRRRRPAIG